MITLMKAVFASCVALCTALTPINAEQVTQLGNGVRNIQFVDEDGDGICDNYNGNSQTANSKQNGIHKADGTGNANKNNNQYIDEDSDGICDNYNKEAQTTNPKQNGIRKADGTGNANGKNSNKNNYCRK